MSAAEEITELPSVPMVTHALKTARSGYPVLLVEPGGKKAVEKGWPQQATTDPDQVGRLWRDNRHANHGYTLPGRVAIDIDRHNADGFVTWETVTAGREVPATRRVLTPNNGEHLVFELRRGWTVKSTAGALGPGVDVKSGPAAYLVGPGSRTPNGIYTLACDQPPAPLPEWLADELRGAGLVDDGTVPKDASAGTSSAPTPVWEPHGRFGEPIPVGQRHGTLMPYACSMRARRLSLAEARPLMRLRFHDCEQTPGDPYTWAEAEAVLDDVWRRYPSGSNAALKTSDGAHEDDSSSPPVADAVMFYGLLGEIVRAADPHTEADPVGVLVSLLAGVSAVLGDRPHLMIGSTRHPLLMWPLLFGRTGSSRKGEATETAKFFLLRSYPRAAELTVSGLSSGEGLIERIRDILDENDQGGSEDKRLLVIETEFASVMARAKREGSTLAAVLRQAWDGQALQVLNRDALKASGSHVAIIGHVTPREFRMRLAEAELAGGTYNRFLPFHVERSKRLALPSPIPESIYHPLNERLGRAIAKGREVDHITLNDDSRGLWEHLYDDLTASDDEDAKWQEFTRRTAPYALRIAALFAVLDGQEVVEPEHLNAAVLLVHYAVDTARYVLGDLHRDPRVDKIRRAIDAAAEGLSRTEISALFSRNLSRPVLDELLDGLVATGNYASVETSTGGRPALCYRRVTKKEESLTNGENTS